MWKRTSEAGKRGRRRRKRCRGGRGEKESERTAALLAVAMVGGCPLLSQR